MTDASKAGWSWGCVSAIDSRGRMIWICLTRIALEQLSQKSES